MKATRRPTRVAATAALAVAALACSPRSRHDDLAARAAPGLVAADAIRRMNVPTAWDVVRRSGFMLTPTVDRAGRPSRLQTRRGRSSLQIASSDTPLLLLDGVRTADFRVLETVPARTLLFVRYVSAIEATVSQGTNAGGGLIEVRTISNP